MINCSGEANTCKEHRITKFPTIRFYMGERWFKYTDELEENALYDWTVMMGGPSVHWIDSIEEFDEEKSFYDYSILGIVKENAFNDVMVIREMSQHYKAKIRFFGIMLNSDKDIWSVKNKGKSNLHKNGYRLIFYGANANKEVEYFGDDTLRDVSEWIEQTKQLLAEEGEKLIKEGMTNPGSGEKSQHRGKKKMNIKKEKEEKEMNEWKEL
eukprot:MONOS_3829.1-p1 / transcript=MONOS_3829.1 / gene=MONOS_3829 / organism=Monocercomonoides_exilis_PA203 / gene_product=unspecified product / transcript_product=unspecified product / location=Mono_scaffold00094:62271-63039(-) / protein_length=211 / sequence_SO=supercontig / SO=protein_coding / is_pseudo=false